jgi:hypothetical protein
MFALKTYNHFESSLSNAKTVVGLEWIYEGVRNHLGKILASILVLLIGLPFVFFFGFWLQTKRKKFSRHMKKEIPLFKSSDGYLNFKEHLKKLDGLTPSLKKVSEYNLKKAPWPLSYTLGQMQKMASTLVTYNGWLKKRLDPLNEEKFSSNSKVFKFVSEKELWKNRNQAYKYWM